jgi:hypothetical protein
MRCIAKIVYNEVVNQSGGADFDYVARVKCQTMLSL